VKTLVCGMKTQQKTKKTSITLPKNIYDLIENEILSKGYYMSLSEYIREVIKEDLKKRGLLK